MSVHRSMFSRLVAVASLVLLPCLASAQSSTAGAIAGVVKDTTGAVLPGVTVEASSPALIEKTRAAVTDDQGNYKILELRPGIYTVTYSLPGFSTVKREGLELTTGFTANVSVEMKVGAVEETVTVTGASPVVDVQNVRQQTVLTKELWEALPTGKTLRTYAQLTLGAVGSTPDVGGTSGDKAGGGGGFSYHGAGQNESQVTVDGMRTNAPTRAGTGPWTRTTVNNQLAFEEQTIGSGVSAEQENPGLLINMVPRDGSNVFSGVFALNGSGPKLQSNNLTQELQDRGVRVQGTVVKLYDAGGGFGGPIKKDRLWFFASERWWNAANIIPGAFYNLTPNPLYGAIPVYSPDVSRPGLTNNPNHNTNLRMTWQVNNAHKVSGFLELQSACTCFFSTSATRSPDSSQNFTAPWGSKNVVQGTWTYVKGSRWLFSAGNSSLLAPGRSGADKNFADGALPLRDLTTGFAWNAKGDDPQLGNNPGECCTPFSDGRINGFGYAHDQRYSVTYSTGSHTFKLGGRMSEHGNLLGTQSYNDTAFGPVVVQVRGGVCLTEGCTPPPPVPAAILLLVNPQGPASTENRGGVAVLQTALFAQEQWTMNRLTLNLGVRYDGMRGKFRAYTSAPNNYVGSIDFPEVDNSPVWDDIVPRLGVAYDLFGNGKTAIKGSWGKFVLSQTQAGVQPSDQLGFGGGVRTWNDTTFAVGDPRRGNFVPDCVLTNPLANGECGQLPNVNRGLPTAPSTFYSDAYMIGWNTRPHQWSSSLSVQHQLAQGVGVSVGYFRTTTGNHFLSDNTLVVPSDYDTYCVTAPTDPRLGTSGSRLCGFSNIKREKFGQNRTLFTTAEELGVKPVDQFNGVDIGVNARFGRGGMVSGGVQTGQTLEDRCYTIDAPHREGYCRNVKDWMQGTQVKLFGNYPLPWWGVQLSATFLNFNGPGFSATRTYSNAEIAPSLGRNLSSCPSATGACTATASISLRPQDDPNLGYQPRYSQTDLRIAKTFLFGRLRAQGQFDMYNLFNANPVLSTNSNYTTASAVWPRVTSILGARLLKFGVQLDWK